MSKEKKKRQHNESRNSEPLRWLILGSDVGPMTYDWPRKREANRKGESLQTQKGAFYRGGVEEHSEELERSKLV
jgi:hypothetical protein